MLYKAFGLPLEEGLRFERRLFHGLFATSDQKEGENSCSHSIRVFD
jgi:enoyl-CoA hydratase